MRVEPFYFWYDKELGSWVVVPNAPKWVHFVVRGLCLVQSVWSIFLYWLNGGELKDIDSIGYEVKKKKS